jgi:hypothetical protein
VGEVIFRGLSQCPDSGYGRDLPSLVARITYRSDGESELFGEFGLCKLPYPPWFRGVRVFNLVAAREHMDKTMLQIIRDDLSSRLRYDAGISSEMVNALLCLPSDDIITYVNWYRDAALFDQLTLAYECLRKGELPPDDWLSV